MKILLSLLLALLLFHKTEAAGEIEVGVAGARSDGAEALNKPKDAE